MKLYEKPSIEVISMKTAENIADDSLIKTIYTRTIGATGSNGGYTAMDDAGRYDSDADINGSNPVA